MRLGWGNLTAQSLHHNFGVRCGIATFRLWRKHLGT